MTYSPGDSFGIVCENDPEEVKWLIDRLHLPSNGDALAEIKIAPNPRYAGEFALFCCCKMSFMACPHWQLDHDPIAINPIHITRWFRSRSVESNWK